MAGVPVALFPDGDVAKQHAFQPAAPVETVADLKVAFLGDHGTSAEARAVFQLIKSEDTDLVISQGDLGYHASADEFEKLINETLGSEFPFFASLGNHDRKFWREYRELLTARASRISGVRCVGEIGVRAACTFKGLFFINSAAHVSFFQRGALHADFMERQLARSPSRWRLCSWHLIQAAMQVGYKEDNASWDLYEACRRGGAMIVTAHHHAYARSHLIGEFSDRPEVVSFDGDTVEIRPGQTIAVVSGLGGESVRPQGRTDDWWAAVYTADQDARPGALFCTFHAAGQADRARCYFKAIDGTVPDRFDLFAPRDEAWATAAK